MFCPKRWRAGALLTYSAAFYLLAEPRGVVLPLLSVSIDYLCTRALMQDSRRVWLRRAIVALVAVKGVALVLAAARTHQPVGFAYSFGLMVFVLSGADCVASACRGELRDGLGLLRFALYCCFFPRLYAGPLVSYPEFSAQLDRIRDEPLAPQAVRRGVGRLLLGLFKILLPASYFERVFTELRQFPEADVTVLSGWLLLLAFALSAYYLYSGYCDAALGIGALFGLKLPQNFYYPYQSRNVADFFDRFNSTVTAFIRRTLTQPLAVLRAGTWAEAAGLLLTGVFFGLWLGLRAGTAAWGLYLGVFLLLERFVFHKALDRLPVILTRIYCFFVVLLGFALLAHDSFSQSLRLLSQLFGLESSAYNNRVLYLLTTNWPFLAAGCFFATNLTSLVTGWLRRGAPRVYAAVATAADIVLLALLTALML